MLLSCFAHLVCIYVCTSVVSSRYSPSGGSWPCSSWISHHFDLFPMLTTGVYTRVFPCVWDPGGFVALMLLLYKWLRKFPIFTVFHYGRFSTRGSKTQLENDILKRQKEIWAQNRCQKTRLGVFEDCVVTGCDFLYNWLRKFSIFTVFHYRRFSVWGPRIQLENDILRRQIEIWA